MVQFRCQQTEKCHISSRVRRVQLFVVDVDTVPILTLNHVHDRLDVMNPELLVVEDGGDRGGVPVPAAEILDHGQNRQLPPASLLDDAVRLSRRRHGARGVDGIEHWTDFGELPVLVELPGSVVTVIAAAMA